MAPIEEKSSLKRDRHSIPEQPDTKKPRRSERLSHVNGGDTTRIAASKLPSPVTNKASSISDKSPARGGTPSPPEDRPDQLYQRTTPPPTPKAGKGIGLPSPRDDTQPFSQAAQLRKLPDYEVDDEVGEGVWGYLIPLDDRFGKTLVLRTRAACPVSKNTLNSDGTRSVGQDELMEEEAKYEETKKDGLASAGYLIGRHPECDRVMEVPTISNRHCLIFHENKGGDTIAVIEDLSGNGTYVNEHRLGRNKRVVLKDDDEVSIMSETRCLFRYPKNTGSKCFNQQFIVHQQLGRGHFASVYLATEKCTGLKYAVKRFDKTPGPGERSKVEGLHQEIAVLMGVSHPNMLCLKESFDEEDAVYLVLELAAEGELFNWIVTHSKLTEDETRKVFIQLFQGVKYLHERSIVHRDIKPENILLVDKELHLKLADFGLAKIIGEESFTTTLCGTPSYVAPEILEQTNHRRYTRAVDIWSLGVVLYICLCGFPPFSDELYTSANPYTLAQQIKMGRFDYPSPYWDPISDIALDLIDRMLTVNVERRITIDECLEHPWTTRSPAYFPEPASKPLTPPNETHSTNGKGNGHPIPSAQSSAATTSFTTDNGLAGAFNGLDFSRRKPQRERTLLADINEVRVRELIPIASEAQKDHLPLKLWEKNKSKHAKALKKELVKEADGIVEQEQRPGDGRAPQDFLRGAGGGQGGVGGDQPLFGGDTGSVYMDQTMRAPEK